MMLYRWKQGAEGRIPVDAQTAGERLEFIRATKGGLLTAEDVVEDARPDGSPLHPAFEWDGAKAAEAWRIHQARDLIRSVIITLAPDESERPREVRAFVVVKQEQRQAYTATVVALADDAMRQQVVARALAEAQQWKRRYQELQELAEVFEAIDRTLSLLV